MASTAQVFGGFAEKVMANPWQYQAVHVYPEDVYFAVFAHLGGGIYERIGNFDNAPDAVAYGMLIGVYYSLTLRLYIDADNPGEWTGNSVQDIAQWYTCALSESDRRAIVGAANCSNGLAKDWQRLTLDGQAAVKAKRLQVVTIGLRYAAALATSACSGCGVSTEDGGLCAGCRSNQSVRMGGR
jgi:hypothetical protein